MVKPTNWETVRSPTIKMFFEEDASILVGEDVKYHTVRFVVSGDAKTTEGGSLKKAVIGYIGAQQDVPYTRKETHNAMPAVLKDEYKQFFLDALDVDITT